MDELRKALKIAFASQFAFYLKAHYFHWNVEGADFSEYHKLFEGIYDEAYGAVDPFAENIRKVGAYTPGSFERFSMLTRIEDETEIPPALEMVRILLEDSDKLATIMGMVYKLAEAEGEFGVANFLADRQDAQRKHSWMLRATLK
jgi:starvation-inducible DNA-binding protein